MNQHCNSFVSDVLARLATAFRASRGDAVAQAVAPAMVEPLEQRQMMSGTVYSVNIVGVASNFTPPFPAVRQPALCDDGCTGY